MAIIPLKQIIELNRPPSLDDYGEPITSDTSITMKCRFVEKTELVKRYTSGVGVNQTMSEEVVSSAQIYLDKFADVRYTDEILYTDEANNVRKYMPLKIERKRDFGGKTLLTVVYV